MGDADTIKDIISEVDTDNVSLRISSIFSDYNLFVPSIFLMALLWQFTGWED